MTFEFEAKVKRDKPRLGFFLILFSTLMAVLMGGLVKRQILMADEYKDLERQQHLRKIVRPAVRGRILDRDGNVLAENAHRYGASIDLDRLRGAFRARYRELRRRLVGDNQPVNSRVLEREARIDVVTSHLARINAILDRSLNISSREIENHFATRRQFPLPLVQDLSEAEFAKLFELLPVDSPIDPFVEAVRHYPCNETACHLLGIAVRGDRLRFCATIAPESLVRDLREEALRLQAAQARSRTRQQALTAPDALNQAAVILLSDYLRQICDITGRPYAPDTDSMEEWYGSGAAGVRPYLFPAKGRPIALIEDLNEEEAKRLREELPAGSPVRVVLASTRYANAAGREESIAGDMLRNEKSITTYRDTVLSGRSGMERAMDTQLSGADGLEEWVVDPSGRQRERVRNLPATPGLDVQLSIDLDIQRTLENALGEGFSAGVMLDVRTGEVLAMASRPGFDNNIFSPSISSKDYQDVLDRQALRNLATQGLYPPASPFKLVTTLAGMEAGVLTPGYKVVCRGQFPVGNRIFHCHEKYSGHSDAPDYPGLDLQQAIAASCNPFFYQTALDTGPAHLAAMARRVGLDKPTGIELPFETNRMLVPDKEWKRRTFLEGWTDGDTANMAIGQGSLRVTPLQLGAFAASLARRETRTRVTLLRQPGPPASHGGEPLPIDDDGYARILNGMKHVVDGEIGGIRGTGRAAAVDGLVIAGKTGTAQFRADGQALNAAWFIGFAPADDPKVAVAVLVEGRSPNSEVVGATVTYPVSGGKTAGPVAKAIFKAWLDKQRDANR